MKRIPYSVIRFPIAFILFFSSVTKGLKVASEPSDQPELWAMGIVLFELALALALTTGIFPKLVKYLTAAVFDVFFCVALVLAFQSAASCGCFGRLHVDPRITACMDFTVGLVLLFSKTEVPIFWDSRGKMMYFSTGVVLSFFSLIPMSLHPPVVRVEHATVAQSVDDQPQSFGIVPETLVLGYAEPKSVHRATFEILNPSEQELPIDSVKAECECISIIQPPEKILPKSQSSIVLEFTAPDISGTYLKNITVTSGEKTWIAHLKARINHPLAAEPPTLTFKKDEHEKSFRIVNEGKQPVRLLYALSAPAVCSVAIDAQPVEPGQSKTLHLTLFDVKDVNKIILKVQTNHPIQKIIEIPVEIQK
jgi:hypothetical protein